MNESSVPRITETDVPVEAFAPGKVILFGEHAVNRGQPALSASIGLRAFCRVSLQRECRCFFRSSASRQAISRESILTLAGRIESYRSHSDFEAIRRLAAVDYFAPAKYILGSAFGDSLPGGLTVEWQSEIPSSSGLGSGGAAFTALVTAMDELLPKPASLAQRAAWAHLGDVIAHGGIASALDTQTSLLGGIIHYTGEGLADPVSSAPGLSLVIGHSGVSASTSEVNTRVRLWLEEKPASRMAYFQMIGALSRAALPVLNAGNWDELGRLFNLNQLVLEKIGVSCPEIERLIEVALNAGALGAKLSGSGGGGIIIALTTTETRDRVAAAIAAAGGTSVTPEIAVAGATLSPCVSR
jgi:mevalonate kinase